MMIILSFVKSGKMKDNVHCEDIDFIKCEFPLSRFGFNWWYWIPKIKILPSKSNTTIFEVILFCFNFEISKH